MLRGYTFDKQVFTSKAFANFVNTFLNGESGIVNGCDVFLNKENKTFTLGKGNLIIKGRILEVLDEIILDIPNVSMGTYYIVCEIDLSKTNTLTDFNQASIKIINGNPIQQDILNDGSVYQFPINKFMLDNYKVKEFLPVGQMIGYDSVLSKILAELKKVEKQTDVVLRPELENNYLTITEYNQTKNVIKNGYDTPTVDQLKEDEIYIQIINK